MDANENQDEAVEPLGQVKSVAAAILSEFFDTLEKEDGFSDISPRLRKIILEDGIFAETAIRAALFPEVL